MTTVRMVEYEEASAEVRAVFDDIMESRGIDFVPNFWKTIAHHPPTLKSVWSHLKRVMAPGAVDAKTKEMIAIAVSATSPTTSTAIIQPNLARSEREEKRDKEGAFGMRHRVLRTRRGLRLAPDIGRARR